MHVGVAVIGGGIAGLSAAAYLAPRTSVIVLEKESTLGYHATGRSAALYTECYGADPIRRLALASRSFFDNGAEPFGSKRGVLFVAPPTKPSAIPELHAALSPLVADLEILSPSQVNAVVPVIPADRNAGGLLEPGALDLDVHAILSSYASTLRDNGGVIATTSQSATLEYVDEVWQIRAGSWKLTADVLVNAAGAWADTVAASAGVQPMELTPLKRSAFTFDPGMPTSEWPMVLDIGENWYFKPEGPYLLGSAASEILQEPHDARHDELDVALGIMRISEATTLEIPTVKNQWAGLRTFTPDRVPAVGFDPQVPRFFWLVGQGGYGIHTSPAMGAMSAGLILDKKLPGRLLDFGIRSEMFDPARFR